jgi:hypothetical protein
MVPKRLRLVSPRASITAGLLRLPRTRRDHHHADHDTVINERRQKLPSQPHKDSPLTGVRSLVWVGDDLVDWVGGGYRFHPDGSASSNTVNYAYAFDRAVGSPSGTYAVIYAERGTKGLVLKDEFPKSTDWRHSGAKILRQIDRDFYHANHYDYAVALGRLRDGREILVHCPESYTHPHIDKVESGRRLSIREYRRADFFHSRLQISPDGRYLLSAGWVWHPVNMLMVFDLEAALEDATTLDGRGVMDPYACVAEVEFAAFDGSQHVLVMWAALMASQLARTRRRGAPANWDAGRSLSRAGRRAYRSLNRQAY